MAVLSADGSLLAAAVNAATLALVDAGVPMPGLLCACTVGLSGRAATAMAGAGSGAGSDTGTGTGWDVLDPLLDVSGPEEVELPFLTVATTTAIPGAGADDDDDEESSQMLSVVQMGAGVHVSYLETMFAVGIDGCKQVRDILNGVLKAAGRRVLAGEGVRV